MTLQEIEALCVRRFDGRWEERRERFFLSLEGVIQDLLNAKIRCCLYIDGSFFTEKLDPGDVDVLAIIDKDAFDELTESQRQVFEALNNLTGPVDCMALTKYPRGHERYGTALDGGSVCDCYGLEHGKQWLKGYAVLRLWETDVGNRICR